MKVIEDDEYADCAVCCMHRKHLNWRQGRSLFDELAAYWPRHTFLYLLYCTPLSTILICTVTVSPRIHGCTIVLFRSYSNQLMNAMRELKWEHWLVSNTFIAAERSILSITNIPHQISSTEKRISNTSLVLNINININIE